MGRIYRNLILSATKNKLIGGDERVLAEKYPNPDCEWIRAEHIFTFE